MTAPRLSRAGKLRTDLAIGVDFVPRARTGADVTALPPAIDEGDPSGVVVAAAASPSFAAVEAVESGASSAIEAVSPLRRPGERRADALARLRELHDAQCPHCTRATAHTNLVFGEGNPDAKLVFVGEAPGETEDRLGRPFVGRAGQKLDEMIAAMGLRREDIYIANVLKSRPPNNRTPLPEEVTGCGPTLLQQLAIIRPTAIITLGAPATKFLLQSDVGITRLRGVWSAWRIPPALGGGEIPVMPTFHPAYLLRNYTPETRKAVWSDLQLVMERLGLRTRATAG